LNHRKGDDFEYYLTEVHAEQYIGTKDCMIDDYEKWVCDLGVDELIELGNRFYSKTLDKITLALAEKINVERIEKVIGKIYHCGSKGGINRMLKIDHTIQIAQAIVSDLLK
jgi:hypothetical protein